MGNDTLWKFTSLAILEQLYESHPHKTDLDAEAVLKKLDPNFSIPSERELMPLPKWRWLKENRPEIMGCDITEMIASSIGWLIEEGYLRGPDRKYPVKLQITEKGLNAIGVQGPSKDPSRLEKIKDLLSRSAIWIATTKGEDALDQLWEKIIS